LETGAKIKPVKQGIAGLTKPGVPGINQAGYAWLSFEMCVRRGPSLAVVISIS
jgi:hypothetical protein